MCVQLDVKQCDWLFDAALLKIIISASGVFAAKHWYCLHQVLESYHMYGEFRLKACTGNLCAVARLIVASRWGTGGASTLYHARTEQEVRRGKQYCCLYSA